MHSRIASVGPHVEEADDASESLFVPDYLFAGEDVTQGGHPAETIDQQHSHSVDDSPPWETAPPATEPTDNVQTDGANGGWFLWTGAAPLLLKNGDHSDVLSIWIPVGPPATITVVAGFGTGGGGGFYATNSPKEEVIPVAKGNKVVTLSSDQVFPQPIYVFCTNREMQPRRSS